jgi:fatty acid desaturase
MSIFQNKGRGTYLFPVIPFSFAFSTQKIWEKKEKKKKKTKKKKKVVVLYFFFPSFLLLFPSPLFFFSPSLPLLSLIPPTIDPHHTHSPT